MFVDHEDEIFSKLNSVDHPKISQYPDNLYISNYGKILNIETMKVLKPVLNKDGYYYFTRKVMNKYLTTAVHRIVAITFVHNENLEKTHVNHIDYDKHNNFSGNLEWMTPSENTRYSSRNGRMPQVLLNEEKVLDIASRLSNGEHTSNIALHYGTTVECISNILNKKYYSDITKNFDFNENSNIRKIGKYEGRCSISSSTLVNVYTDYFIANLELDTISSKYSIPKKEIKRYIRGERRKTLLEKFLSDNLVNCREVP